MLLMLLKRPTDLSPISFSRFIRNMLGLFSIYYEHGDNTHEIADGSQLYTRNGLGYVRGEGGNVENR
jgi:hypothetical protein